MSKTAEGTSA